MDDETIKRVMSELARRSAAKLTPEQRSERARHAAAARRPLTPEELTKRAKLGVAGHRRKKKR